MRNFITVTVVTHVHQERGRGHIHTVGGIKTVTFPFRTIPSKWNTSIPFTVQFPFRARKRSINTLGVSYQRVRNQS